VVQVQILQDLNSNQESNTKDMDAEDFKTLGECEFGTIWEVQSENKIVVNAYQAAFYFAREDFLQFAKMVEDSTIAITGQGFKIPKPEGKSESKPEAKPAARKEAAEEAPQITDIRAFRKKSKPQEPENDDFPG